MRVVNPYDEPAEDRRAVAPQDMGSGDGGLRPDRGSTNPARTACIVGGCGLVLAAGSVALPWLRVGAAGRVLFYSGISMPLIGPLLLLAVAAALVAILVHLVRSSALALDIANLLAGFIACLTAIFLMLAECASALIPNGLLPATLRRYTLDLRAGPGLWLAFAGAAVALAALNGHPGRRLSVGGGLSARRLAAPSMRAEHVRRLGPPLALGLLAVAFGFVRYGSWVQATVLGQHYGIGGWSLPFVGPISNVSLIGMIAATALSLAGRDGAVALIAAASGWLITLAAGLTWLLTDTLARVRVVDFAPASLRGYAPHLATGGATLLAFLLGLAAAGVAALTLWRTEP